MNAMSPERRVLTYGTFDGMGAAHVRFLRRLSLMGERLIVGLATDALAQARGETLTLPFDARLEVLEACKYVDRVIVETSPEQMRADIVNYNISLLALSDRAAGAFDHLMDVAQVIYVPSDVETAVTTAHSESFVA